MKTTNTAGMAANPFAQWPSRIRGRRFVPWAMTLVFSMIFALPSAQAQFTANNQTNVISGTLVDYGGNSYFVGYTNYGDVLIIQNGGTLINGNGGMAAVYTSSNNLAIVTGAGSAWTNNGYLILSGEDYSYGPGPNNRLVITNGGRVYSVHGYIGGNTGGPANDSALVTSPGSSWVNAGQFVVGFGSGGNTLVVSNGGWVSCGQGYLGYQNADGTAWITGAGSTWTNSGDLQAGSYGGGTRLMIQDGGLVTDANGYIGFNSSDNQVWVMDPGSVWTNRGNLCVGNAGTGNLLVLTNGGSALAGSNLIVGVNGQGKLVVNGGSATVAALVATRGTNSLVEFDGGTVTAGQVLVNNGPLFTLGDGAQTALLEMTGPDNLFCGSVWVQTNATLSGCLIVSNAMRNDGTLTAGCGGRCVVMQSFTNNGTLRLVNGTALDVFGPLVNNGTIIATNGVVRAYGALVNNGTVTGNAQDMHDYWTSGSGGKWEDAANWSQSAPGSTFWCVISNAISKTVLLDSASAVQTQTMTVVALNLSSPAGGTNTLSLVNSGLTAPLQAQYQLNIGPGGKLTVTNGAVAVGVLNGQSMVNDGEVTLASASLTVTNGPLWMGVAGAGQLTASNSAIASGDMVLGASLAGGNTLTVSGANSIWSGLNLAVGQNGGSNQVSFTGGTMYNLSTQMGVTAAASNNFALVSGAGTIWSNRTSLVIGAASAGNQMTVTNGAVVASSNVVIGSAATASGNLAWIAGAGTVWSNRDAVVIGLNGGSNSLTIGNGALLSCSTWKPAATNFIGYASDSNSVFVTGAGSVWRALGPLCIGNNGSGNRLVVTNGGLLSSISAVLGGTTVGGNNTVSVAGPGSIWTNLAGVIIGLSNSGNGLIIRSGASVISGRDQSSSTLGFGTNSRNNSVLVSDTGSFWIPGPSVNIGYSGSGNSLVIDSNAMVVGSGVIGVNASSSNNTVRVANNAAWQGIGSPFFLGMQGSSNALIIAGGSVICSGLTVGSSQSAGCDNLLELDSGALICTNRLATAILDVRRGKLVMNGGILQVDKLIVTNACSQFVRRGGTLLAGTVVLDPNLSAAGDGIPNGWKMQYGLDPFDATVATADSDHDGANNSQEYLAGTNPTNAASVFHAVGATSAADAGVTVTWSTVGGHSYVVQTNNNPGFSAFADFSPVISVGGTDEGTTNYVDAGALTNFPTRLYRIRLGP